MDRGVRCRKEGFEAYGRGRAVPQGRLLGLWTGASGAAGKALRPLDRGARCHRVGFKASGLGQK